MDNSKLSVIVPTMWKFPPFVSFLKDLVKIDFIGEIIIINNSVVDTVNDDILHNAKIKLFNFPENIFVNPAWNYGVAQSSFENICLLSDDVIFDIKLIDRLKTILAPGKMFVVNLPNPSKNTTVTGTIRIDKFIEGQSLFHFGCLMFLNKSDWIPVPAGLNIYYGDAWLWDLIKRKTGENYVINDLFLYTPTNATGRTIIGRENIYNRETMLVNALWTFLPRLTIS